MYRSQTSKQQNSLHFLKVYRCISHFLIKSTSFNSSPLFIFKNLPTDKQLEKKNVTFGNLKKCLLFNISHGMAYIFASIFLRRPKKTNKKNNRSEGATVSWCAALCAWGPEFDSRWHHITSFLNFSRFCAAWTS